MTNKLLRDIIAFVASRTDITRREDILREINYSWGEIWNSDDLPNSLFEITVKGSLENTARLTLPWYVGQLKAVKANSRMRVGLQTPRPYYQDDTWIQSPYTWRILGLTPLKRTITNASRLVFSLSVPTMVRFTITVIGTTDMASSKREQLVFNIGDTTKTTLNNFIDCTDISKDTILDQDVFIAGVNNEELGIIPSLSYQARHVVVQIYDRCNKCCTACFCWDVAYKIPAPVLFYDEQSVPYPEVLMTKTLEWITMPKDGQEQKTALWAGKSKDLLTGLNANQGGVEHKLDVGIDRFHVFTGVGTEKI